MQPRGKLFTGFALFWVALSGFGADEPPVDPGTLTTKEPVARLEGGRIMTPVNQVLTPVGQQVYLPDLRPQALALSPDGQILVVSGKTAEIVVVSPTSGNILQRAALPSEDATDLADRVSSHILKPDEKGQLSYTGLIFSPDGSRLFLANVNGSIKVFSVSKEHRLSPLASIPLPAVNAVRRKAEIPSGLAISADGRRLYVVFNLSNRLAELDAATGRVLRSWDTGVAPYTVVLGNNKAYVSNWGGRRPDRDSITGPAGRGTLVRVDPTRYIASEGTVTIIDLQNNRLAGELQVGLHSSAMALSPNGRYLLVANAGSDTLSVIDTRSEKVVEAIWTRQNPGDLFGASPNALAFDKSGQTLFVCNGTQNAVAVVSFAPGKSKLQGLIPVGWFPGAIVNDAPRGRLYVANIKGVSPGEPRKSDGRPRFNSHQYYGSISLLDRPANSELPALTAQALGNMRFPLLAQAALRPRPGQPSRPVPERVGEPSLFKHVVYIIKENRTYDQVLGDVRQGKGDPELCAFDATITPNQHKLVRDFVLLDNTYCSSICSADGHQWATTAFATDYMEKSFAGFPRSYPDGMEDDDVDAIAYSPAGFIWDNAIAHGKTLRDYGEFGMTRKSWVDKTRRGEPGFTDHYREFLQGTHTINLFSVPAVESLRPYLVTNTVGWDLEVPDVFRAAQFITELKQFEQTGKFPELVLICLPNDHTSGTDPGRPTPAAQVADNDLAFGQIVDAISHSQFWKDTCIFAIEDDPQAGWDHVSGYRTTAYVISPYTRRRTIVSTQYNHTSILRTLELILGLPPMNQMDATASPMYDCFTNVADLSPYTALTNNVPLDQMNPPAKKIANAILRKDAYVSARLPLKKPDQCPEDTLNRILWHATKGPNVPYPTWAVQMVDDD
ncbi:MAG TPA: alkaline phosphatase family protein [Patescibacteria group bacterium]|nr:alkaline phosphatase family protein [Patescibacteria group bacterium]